MILYLIRHGKTEGNSKDLVQGRKDVMLSEEGIKEAEKLKDLVKSLDIDVVISSPLKRAVDTAKIITDKNINIDDRLIERDWGLNEGASIMEVDTVKCWNVYLNTNDNGIEPIKDFLLRLSEFIEDTKAKYKDEKVLVVTHSAVLRGMHYIINGIPEDGDLSKIDIPNLRIIEYEI